MPALLVADTNFAVGTIFGIWPGDRLVGISGRQLAGAGMAVYGPRTTMTIALEGHDHAHEFLLVDDFSGRHGQWVKTNTFSTIEDGKLFAPGNLRGTQDNPGYNELFKCECCVRSCWVAACAGLTVLFPPLRLPGQQVPAPIHRRHGA